MNGVPLDSGWSPGLSCRFYVFPDPLPHTRAHTHTPPPPSPPWRSCPARCAGFACGWSPRLSCRCRVSPPAAATIAAAAAATITLWSYTRCARLAALFPQRDLAEVKNTEKYRKTPKNTELQVRREAILLSHQMTQVWLTRVPILRCRACDLACGRVILDGLGLMHIKLSPKVDNLNLSITVGHGGAYGNGNFDIIWTHIASLASKNRIAAVPCRVVHIPLPDTSC